MKKKINYTVSMPLSSPRQQFCTVTWVRG